jgi:hypothetical protein
VTSPESEFRSKAGLGLHSCFGDDRFVQVPSCVIEEVWDSIVWSLADSVWMGADLELPFVVRGMVRDASWRTLH